MSHWQKIRNAAKNLNEKVRKEYNKDASELIHADLFIEMAIEFLDLECINENPKSSNLRNAQAVLEDEIIFIRSDINGWYRTFCIAHEIGHFKIHHTSSHCLEDDISHFSIGEDSASSAVKAVGYGIGERREREANLFALELLLPCEVLRNEFLENKQNANKIATLSGLPFEIVTAQISRALLVPIVSEKAEGNQKTFDLDSSQKNAAHTKDCPMLVSAGPGTGKTQTLINRVSHLIENGIAPENILALTFSNKAAEEMCERVAKENAYAAIKIDAMTFHAFGLNLLRKYYVEANLEKDSKLLDKIDALLYLEESLTQIDLEHYQMLHEPTMNLSAILGAISRAKDECCSPTEYIEYGETMLAEATEDDEKIKAEKVLETARVYEFYEKFLTENKMLDFGDLIYKSVKLLRENEIVKREISAKYDAILVDEFQDVNRACGMLLKEIADDGENLWAVGDVRQSIYRWRGASPANIKLFAEDYANATTIPLETNYRSDEQIVELFKGFAKQMKAAGEDVFYNWKSNLKTENPASVKLEIADSIETEGENIAEQIHAYNKKGLQFKQQAVICRTHKQLAEFAEILTEKDVPVFYLGQIFERDEVRDLLCLLDLKFSKNAHTLYRVAQFPEYKIPLEDVNLIIKEFAETEISFNELLGKSELIEKLSDTGKIGIDKLKKHLFNTKENVSAWEFLSQYLFSESIYLQKLFETDDIQNQSKRLAIYQFLRLAQTLEEKFFDKAESQITEFLNYVKKLAWFNEDKNYAQIPASAESLDAVRLLTVHSAKGLEFDAVFLPYLGAGKIPSRKQNQTCPNPDGMIEGEKDFHEEEEECLFFVAMSRAKKHLHLSRSTKYGKSNSKESKFLTALNDYLPNAIEHESAKEKIAEVLEELSAEKKLESFYWSEIDTYLRCPRKYFYQNVLGLKEKDAKSVYLKFHSCVYETMNSMRAIKSLNSIDFTEENALKRLEDFWNEYEIEEHPYSPIYKSKAIELVKTMFAHLQKTKEDSLQPTLELKLENGKIRFKPDEILKSADEKSIVLKKYKTGKAPKTITKDDAEILTFSKLQETFPDAEIEMQKIYLTNDETREVQTTKRLINNRRKKYDEAIKGIQTRDFPAKPNSQNCPHCPHFFICPSGE